MYLEDYTGWFRVSGTSVVGIFGSVGVSIGSINAIGGSVQKVP